MTIDKCLAEVYNPETQRDECVFWGEVCKYRIKEDCPDWKKHIEPRINMAMRKVRAEMYAIYGARG